MMVLTKYADSEIGVIKVDIDQILEDSDVDYLYVTSQPPLTVAAGKPFEYQLLVRSKQGGVKMTLDAGPTGMKLQGNGKLVWKVPRGKRLQTESIIISITDKTEQQIFHSFDLNVE